MMKSPVLLYHKIDLPTADVKIRGAFTYPQKFERQVKYLKNKGFELLTASEIVNFFLENGKFPKKAVAITFDDGWKDNYRNAFPILKKYGAKATIFLVPSCVGKTTDKVTAEGEGSREHLSENDIVEMSAGGIEFASHSFNHKLFHQITEKEIEFEVNESKRYIENLTQKDCSIFAYPAGFFTDYAKRSLKNAGYKAAFTTVYGEENNLDVFELNRIEILRRDGFPFRFGRKIKSIYE